MPISLATCLNGSECRIRPIQAYGARVAHFMTLKQLILILGTLSIACGQSQAILPNLATPKWSHDKGDPPGSEVVFLRERSEDREHGVAGRFPAACVHPSLEESNERIIVSKEIDVEHISGDTASILAESRYSLLKRRKGSLVPRRTLHVLSGLGWQA